MAKTQPTEPKRRRSRFLHVKTLGSLTITVACLVLIIGGIQEGVRTAKIVYNCLLVSFVIGFAYWVVIRAMDSYEEMNSGKA